MVPVTVGQTIYALNGPWRFTTGDSPVNPATNQPLWSLPTFDDAGWEPYTLDPQHPNLTAFEAANSSELPGFQGHGHPATTGYSWYRIRLQPPLGAHSLSLLIPQYVDDAYDVFVNGQKIGHFGHLDRWHFVYTGQPELFSLPSSTLASNQPITLALRFWTERAKAGSDQHNLAGGLRGIPLLGAPQPLQVFLQSAQQPFAARFPWLLVIASSACAAVGIISLFLFFFSRRQREYLWAGISLSALAAIYGCISLNQMLQTDIPLPITISVMLVAVLFVLFSLPLATMHLLSVAKPIWRRLNIASTAIDFSYYTLVFFIDLGLLPPSPALDRVLDRYLLFHLPFLLLLMAITIDGLRTIGRKAWPLLTPGFLFVAFVVFATLGNIPAFSIASDLTLAATPLSVLIIFLLRFTQQQRENARLVDDMRQAAEIQQVLIPEHRPPTPNLTIHTEYRPAREVGGDFFQILPHPSDGSDLANSVLIVAGDVTGKGLQAGMLVSLLVGAIRTAADTTSDPLQILQTLNRRLLGRGHAQATALALLLSPNGGATLANAGHIPPYLNGAPLDMEGALPLGMIADADFSVMHLHLDPNDQLVLISDGILEATDAQGRLFGFDRVQQHLRDNLSPAALADAAQQFGQEDDISLISLTRTT